MKPINDLQLYHDISQFYFSEARLLDERKYQSWMELLGPGIEYSMPSRNNAEADVTLKNKESILNIQQEMNQGLEPPLRMDNMMTLTLRANRPTNPTAWADNPAARTRRNVSNIEVYKERSKCFSVYSNTLMYYSRHNSDNHLYSYQRQDVLQKTRAGFEILKRKVVLDWNVITAPTVALIF